MPEFVFSFDVEDYISPHSDDVTKELAEILTEAGVRGCFNMVAEKTRQLRLRGRQDVIEALKRHEIGYHSLLHSFHPTIAEYCDTPQFEEGMSRFLKEESAGLAEVRDTFEVDCVWAAVPPGGSACVTGIYGYTLLGMPIFAATPVGHYTDNKVWLANSLQVPYNFYVDGTIASGGLKGLLAELEKRAGYQTVVSCVHPTILCHSKFWDGVNFSKGRRVAWGQWRMPPSRSAQEEARILSDYRKFVRTVLDDGRFEPITYEEMWKRYGDRDRPGFLSAQAARDLVSRAAAKLDWQERDGFTYSPAEIFALAVWLAAHPGKDDTTPVPVRRLIGPIDTIREDDRSVGVSRDSVRAAAIELLAEHAETMPASVQVNGVNLGPGTFLRAMAQVLTGANEVHTVPGENYPRAVEIPEIGDHKYAGTWLFADDWFGEHNRRYWRAQSWSVRPARRGN